LGAAVRVVGYDSFLNGSLIVELNSEWRGGTADFDYLKQLPGLGRLTIINVQLDNPALRILGELTQVSAVDLIGTGVTNDAAQGLHKLLPGVSIERRNGALLGIRGNRGTTPCQVSEEPGGGTAAEAANIHKDDIIQSIDGKAIEGFDDLYALIGDKKPGDRVTLQIRRADATLTKEIILGRFEGPAVELRPD
jgi:hypothetical protein